MPTTNDAIVFVNMMNLNINAKPVNAGQRIFIIHEFTSTITDLLEFRSKI